MLTQHLDAVLARETFERHAQMHLTLAQEQDLMGVGGVIDAEGGVFLQQLGHGGGELDLVLAVLEPQADGEHALRRGRSLDLHDACLLDRHGLAGSGVLQTAERDDVTGTGRPAFDRLFSFDGEIPATRSSRPSRPTSVALSGSSPVSTRA